MTDLNRARVGGTSSGIAAAICLTESGSVRDASRPAWAASVLRPGGGKFWTSPDWSSGSRSLGPAFGVGFGAGAATTLATRTSRGMSVLYSGAGWPSWNVVEWVLRCSVVARHRASRGAGLTSAEKHGVIRVDRLVAGMAYGLCEIGVAACGLVGAPLIIAGSHASSTPVRAPLEIVGCSIAFITVSAQLVILAWFSIQSGPYKTRSFQTTPRSLHRAGVAAWVLTVTAGVVLGLVFSTS